MQHAQGLATKKEHPRGQAPFSSCAHDTKEQEVRAKRKKVRVGAMVWEGNIQKGIPRQSPGSLEQRPPTPQPPPRGRPTFHRGHDDQVDNKAQGHPQPLWAPRASPQCTKPAGLRQGAARNNPYLPPTTLPQPLPRGRREVKRL